MRLSTLGALGMGGLTLTSIPFVARAEIYLAPEEAVQAMFPGERFDRREMDLSDTQTSLIEKISSEAVRSKRLIAYVSNKKNTVFIDQVVGKHEFITIAVGIAADGSVRGVEILEYRETYGGQVRNADWRKQFVGKKSDSPVKVGSDIQNISGATLSSVHVSNGVRRLLHTYETLRAQI